MKPIVLELPETIRQVQIKDKMYNMNTDDLELCRRIAVLSNDAQKILDGKIPSDDQIKKILSKCKTAIDLALGDGAYQEITTGATGKRQYLLPLFVLGQLKDICEQTEQEYITSQYSTDRIQARMNPEQYLQMLTAISKMPGTIEKLKELAEMGNDA